MPEDILGEKKALDLGAEMVLSEGVETDEELILARELTASIVKTVKAVRFYPPDNPTVKGFRDQLTKKFNFFLNKYPSFILQVGEYDLSFKGKILYENRDMKSSLSFILYKDGVREIRFMRGLEDWEVQGFIDVIKGGENINELEDDIVTLLWEKDFLHISYLATDEFLEDKPILIPENVEQFRANLIFKPIGHEVEVDIVEEGEGETDLDRILPKLMKGRPFLMDRNVYFLTHEEVEKLKKEVEAEIDPTFVFNISDVLFEILALERSREPYQDTANLLNRILDSLLGLSDFKRASDLLQRLYIILKTYDFKDWQREIIQKLIHSAGDEQRIERIGKILEKDEMIQLDDLNHYLVLLQQNSIKPLIKLLGEVKNSKTRRVICDALAEIGKNSIELFTPFIDDKRWFLVRNITYILGRIGKEQSVPYVQKILNHQDPRVRREAILALGLIGGQKAVSLLIRALTNGDPKIRAIAAINLGKFGKSAGLNALLESVQSKDFQKRDSMEIKAFFDAIGMIGSAEAIPVLKELLEKKSWFGRGVTDEIRIGAANALAMIPSSDAKAILEKGSNSRDESIKNACSLALKNIPSKEQIA